MGAKQEKKPVPTEEKPATQKRQEITPDIAKATLAFLDRAQISGAEANTMMIIKQVISGYID